MGWSCKVHRWYPSNLNDYQKGQRHLIRMPVLLLSSFGDDADHLLLGSPSVPGEIREQLTSQQDMFHPAFQAAARILYYDDEKGTIRRGAAGKKGGSARRLARVRQQLDVTWDLLPSRPSRFSTSSRRSSISSRRNLKKTRLRPV
jgi:cation transport regulator ChaB